MLEKIGLPEKPSLRGNNWVVDATHCQGCSSQFTFINRKHHCRRCGGIFCSSCTQQRMVLRGQGDSPVRICDPCKKLEEAARFEMRHGRRGGRGSLKVASRSEDEVLNQVLSNDVKDSSSIQVGTSQDGEEDSGQSLSSNETSHDAGSVSPQELRQQALDEKTKYKLLKGEGKSAEALKAFKRAKELERQAAAVELQLRKDRKKTLASSTMAEIKKSENSSPDSSGKEQPSRQKGKGKDDLTAELKALGWSEMDLHDVDRKPASTSIESELFNLMGKKLNTAHQDKGAHGIDKSQVVALKKNALKLKREGNLVEAKEVLKRAKILEKELEEQELLGDAEDSDDELSALVKSLDSVEQGDLPLGYELSHTFDYDNLTDYAGDIDIDGNFEVTEDDMDDPELAATLKSLGWTEDSTQHEESLPQSVSIDREGLVGEILNMKREAVNQKRIGNISEATSLLKKAKLLEKDLDSIDSHYSPTSSTQHQNADKTSELRGEGARNAGKEINTAPKSRLVIQRELLGMKKKALALRREGKINEAEEELKKGKILEQQLEDIDNASKMKVSEVNIRHEVGKTSSKLPDIPTDLGSIDEAGGDITDQDLHDPTYLALLRNLGWQDEDNEHASSASEVLKQTTHLSTGSTDASFSGLTIDKPRRSKADIQRELLALKRKALALRRQGQSAEAEKLLNTAKELEAQISELDAPSLADNSEDKIMVEAPEEQAVFNISEERGNETAVPPLSQPSEPINARNTSEEMTSAVTDKDNVSPLVSANSLQQEILSHKRKAIGFKREGKLAEAREELKKAKLLERGLTEEKPQTLTKSSIAEVSTPVTTVTQKESWPENVAPKPMTSQERFKLQRECLTHKRNALKLRRDGQTEEAEAELQLARSLETQLEEAAGSDAGSSSKVRATDDAVVDDLLDPQILSALKAIGLQDTSAVSQAQVRVEPTQVKAETLVPGAGQNSNSNEEKAHLEAQIKAEKLKALNLKRSGKQVTPVSSSATDRSGNNAGVDEGQNPGRSLSNKLRKKLERQNSNYPRRFTRSALKLNENKENSEVAISMESSEAGTIDVGQDVEGTLSRTPKRNLEMKMSKQISLSKIPTTVKELLETGLLEGYQVYYNGGKKGAELQGKITGLGILCCCGLCRGRSVIPPSQFEIHACNSYRRAAQYIYLNSGMSLIQLLQACKDSNVNTLEVTIQKAIGPLQKRKVDAPQNCKNTTSRTTSWIAEPISMKPNLSAVVSKCTTCKPSGSVEVSTPKCSESVTMVKASSAVIIQNSEEESSLQKSSTGSSRKHAEKKRHGKITMKDQGLHKLVFGEDGLPDRTALAYFVRGEKLLEGHKEGSGIFCNCCHSVVSASQFEAHAGYAQRKKPYSYIYTSNGVSLHEYAVSLLKGRKQSVRDNDDLCFTCHNGGDLVLCDGCPRSYHKECASLSSVPHGKWFCNYCQTMFEREKFVAHNANALAAGRVSGVDPIEQISNRCIRIVTKSDDHGLTVCALCRCLDFSESGFGPRTILICDQCEKEYHVSCLRDHQMAELEELPQGNWFCGMECERIHSILWNLVFQGNDQLSETLIDMIRKKHGEKCPESEAEFNVSWRLFNGKVLSEGDRPLLAQIVSIFHNGFNPIVYPSGEDLIPALVHGEKVDDVEYGGIFTAALTVDSVVVSAAVFRVFGPALAELPLVATSEGNRGKGFFQTLYACIERLFAQLKVKKIVLPSAEESEGIWTKKFGFSRMTPKEIYECGKSFQTLLQFQGTVMLHKMVPDL